MTDTFFGIRHETRPLIVRLRQREESPRKYIVEIIDECAPKFSQVLWSREEDDLRAAVRVANRWIAQDETLEVKVGRKGGS